MFSRLRVVPVVVLAVAALATTACGGGSKTYKEGTPAATGQAPDCSVVPLDLVNRLLKLDLTGPAPEPRTVGQGWVCTFTHRRGGLALVEQVQLTGNADEDSFAIIRDSYASNNAEIKKIKGYGDEAFATTIFGFSTSNNFVVRKGQVSVQITSTSDYDNIRKLMKEILAKL